MTYLGIMSEQKTKNSIPDCYFYGFSSAQSYAAAGAWVTCQFAKDYNTEDILAVGDDGGNIAICRIGVDKVKQTLAVDRSCVMDMSFVRTQPQHLIVCSGHSSVTLWDFERNVLVQRFLGHQGSVRALSVCDEAPDLFATGARDGNVLIWDQRIKNGNQPSESYAFRLIRMTHPASVALTEVGKTSRRLQVESRGITALLHVDQHTLVTASTSFKTGIRFWDLRYQGNIGPYRTLQAPFDKDLGITSMCLDQYKSRLYAAATDSNIYCYSIQAKTVCCIGILQGAKRPAFNAFDFRVDASPVSDHVIYGGLDPHANLWDLQEFYRHSDNDLRTKYLLYPKFTFGGHLYEVASARFSNRANYIATMDDTYLKLWEWYPRDFYEQNRPKNLPRKYVDMYKLTEGDNEEIAIVQSSLGLWKKVPAKRSFENNSDENILPKISLENMDKRKEEYSNDSSVTNSPVKKIFRSNNKPPSPLRDITNSPVKTPSRNFSFGGDCSDLKNSAFYYKFPTMNMPDFVRDVVASASSDGSMKAFDEAKRPSNCVKIASLVRLESPRKLQMKRRDERSKEQKKRSTGGNSASRKRNSGDTPKRAQKSTGKRTPARRSISGMRTLDHYFNKLPSSA